MNNRTFEIKEEHIKLMKNMYTSWNEMCFGSPTVDPKRPYGDSSVYESMAEILGIKGEEEEYGEMILSYKQRESLYKLHEEMETVLQILLYNCSIKIGTYVNIGYSKEWTLLESKGE